MRVRVCVYECTNVCVLACVCFLMHCREVGKLKILTSSPEDQEKKRNREKEKRCSFVNTLTHNLLSWNLQLPTLNVYS